MKRLVFAVWALLPFSGPVAQENAFHYLVPALGKASCCCGQFTELFFPNLDFEAPPSPPPGTFFTYSAGTGFGGWTVTQATIDHCDALVGNLGLGNPNGPSFFIDLHGSPGFGGISYPLYGLTPGNQYRIEFWTAQNGGGFSSEGTLKIGGGSWLNVKWTVSVSGAVSWRMESYEFVALATSTTMEFSSTGPMVFAGTLVDDIKIFECPGDLEKPEILNPPDHLEVECEHQVPQPPNLQVSDNCDLAPTVAFKETKLTLGPCHQRITREWTVEDDCNNSSTAVQYIDIIDQTPPEFTRLPENKTVACSQDVSRVFSDWIRNRGNAQARDDCGTVSWRTSYERPPYKYCDTLIVEFIAISPCGLESLEYAYFTVIDTTGPGFKRPAQDRNYICIGAPRDSLRLWLDSMAFALPGKDCDTAILSHNFNGDSSQNPLRLTVYARDRCGNTDSTLAVFSYRTASDTFRIDSFSCALAQNRADTSVFQVSGCDSVVITSFIRLLPDTSTLDRYTCDSLRPPADTITLTNVRGCDSTVFIRYSLQQSPVLTIDSFGCHFAVSSSDTMILQGQFCDSTVITRRFPLRKDSVSIVKLTCDSAQAGEQVFVLSNSDGCDSIVTVTTRFSAVNSTSLVSPECGLDAPYSDTLVFTTATCDSIVITLHLPLPVDSTFRRLQTCDPSQAGVFYSLLVNRHGCDSTLVDSVMLMPSDSVELFRNTCRPDSAGVFSMHFQNRFGCDSTVVLAIALLASDTTYRSSSSCNPADLRTDTFRLVNRNGCDSIVFYTVAWSPADTTHNVQSTCDPSMQGDDTLRLVNRNGCDSIVFLFTALLPSDSTFVDSSTCIFAAATSDTLSLQNRFGCDSLVFRRIHFAPAPIDATIDSIRCPGDRNGRFALLNPGLFEPPLDFFLNSTLVSDTSLLSRLGPGSYTLYVRDRRGCTSTAYSFSLDDPAPLVTELDDLPEQQAGAQVLLQLQSNRPLVQVFWQPPHPSGCTHCSDFPTVATADQWFYTLATDDRGCSHSDSLFLRVLRNYGIYAPNVFSPNGDNINDFFYLRGDDGVIIESLEIFDRWGERLFYTQSIPVNLPSAGWDGSSKGQKLNPAVFVFSATALLPSGQRVPLSGDFSLVR
ncbi:MAG: hypothetical protein JPMHGGIA_01810 [Saprospiraceae bacterium]|jgi:gliding motility-associated-like protein|nr:hypothetical protein [Saprospiraceae bacterium]